MNRHTALTAAVFALAFSVPVLAIAREGSDGATPATAATAHQRHDATPTAAPPTTKKIDFEHMDAMMRERTEAFRPRRRASAAYRCGPPCSPTAPRSSA